MSCEEKVEQYVGKEVGGDVRGLGRPKRDTDRQIWRLFCHSSIWNLVEQSIILYVRSDYYLYFLLWLIF